jgi:hypothetical protein
VDSSKEVKVCLPAEVDTKSLAMGFEKSPKKFSGTAVAKRTDNSRLLS